MKRYSYGERDYAFGQMMLTLRTSIGLTQAGLADLLGVSRRAVAEWEAGAYRHDVCPRFQPGRTQSGQRELGWRCVRTENTGINKTC